MAYKCLECGHIFEEGEQAEWEETHGLETPPYEKMSGCPICKGGYDETCRCSVCRGEFLEEEMTFGVCEECLENIKEEYRHDPKRCYEISKDETTKVEINYFLSCMFTESQIEEILLSNLEKAHNLVRLDCSAFMNADKGWFEDKVVEEVKKNENRENKP